MIHHDRRREESKVVYLRLCSLPNFSSLSPRMLVFATVGGSPASFTASTGPRFPGVSKGGCAILSRRDPGGDGPSESVPVIRRTNNGIIPNVQPWTNYKRRYSTPRQHSQSPTTSVCDFSLLQHVVSRLSKQPQNPAPKTRMPLDFVTWKAQATFRFMLNAGTSHFGSEVQNGPGGSGLGWK